MKRNGVFIIVGLIVGLLVGYFVFHEVPTNSNTTPVVIDQDVPPVSSTEQPKIIYRDTTIYKDSIVYQIEWKDRIIEVPIPVDTAAIIADYLMIKNFVFDTTTNDVVVHEETSLFANRILSRSFVITNTRECQETSLNGLSIGGMLGYHDVSLLAGYTHKQNTYLVGYNIYDSKVKVGLLIKIKPIKLWKKN